MERTLFNIADLLLRIVTLAILIRAILSWFYPVGRDRWTQLLVDITEPLLAPIRSVMLRILPIPLDFSPFVAILLISLLQNMLQRAYYGS